MRSTRHSRLHAVDGEVSLERRQCGRDRHELCNKPKACYRNGPTPLTIARLHPGSNGWRVIFRRTFASRSRRLSSCFACTRTMRARRANKAKALFTLWTDADEQGCHVVAIDAPPGLQVPITCTPGFGTLQTCPHTRHRRYRTYSVRVATCVSLVGQSGHGGGSKRGARRRSVSERVGSVGVEAMAKQFV